LENLVFLIIIGIVSAIFGKAKSNRGQSQNKPFSTNSMDDIRTLFKELTNNESRETTPINEPRKMSPIKAEQKKVTEQNNFKNLENEYLQVRQESESSRIGMATSRQQSEKIKDLEMKDKHEEGRTIISEYPDAKTLVNGIVWSEILGEPRSKKSYFANKS
jgi:hypothetical protein